MNIHRNFIFQTWNENWTVNLCDHGMFMNAKIRTKNESIFQKFMLKSSNNPPLDILYLLIPTLNRNQ